MCAAIATIAGARTAAAQSPPPGIESGYMLTGGGVFSQKDQADRKVGPGDSWQVPAETPHAYQNGAAASKIVVVYTVEKNKPLATPAPL